VVFILNVMSEPLSTNEGVEGSGQFKAQMMDLEFSLRRALSEPQHSGS